MIECITSLPHHWCDVVKVFREERGLILLHHHRHSQRYIFLASCPQFVCLQEKPSLRLHQIGPLLPTCQDGCYQPAGGLAVLELKI